MISNKRCFATLKRSLLEINQTVFDKKYFELLEIKEKAGNRILFELICLKIYKFYPIRVKKRLKLFLHLKELPITLLTPQQESGENGPI